MKKIILLLFVALSAMWCKTYAVTDQLPMARFVDSMKETPYKSDQSGIDYQLRGEYDSGAVMFELKSRFYGGVTATSSGMTLGKVTFAWNPDWMMNKQDDVQVVVYGSDEPYASVDDLYDADKRGTEIGRAAYPATEIVVTGGYKNVGICFEAPTINHCAELTAISLDWTSGSSIVDDMPMTRFVDSMKESPYKSDLSGIDYQLRGEYDSGAVIFDLTPRFYGGVTATSSDMTLEKVTFAWNPNWMLNKQDDVQVVVYGSDEPYASVADLYDADKCGTEIGRAAYPATEIVVVGGYKNVGICFEAPNRSYYAELTAIQFVWQGAAAEPMEPLTLVTDKGMSVRGEYTVALAEPTKVLVSSATPDVNIAWTYGERNGSAVGTAEITIDAAGTLQVTATKDGYLKRELSQSFKMSAPLTSIADVWEAYPVPGNGTVLTDEMFEVRFDMTVIFAANVGNDAQVIATDGTNYTRLYMRETQLDLAPGDVIAKGWMSSFRRDAGWKDFLPLVELKAASHDGLLREPIAVGNEDALKELDPGTPVVVRKVTLETATSAEVYRGDEAVKQIKTADSPVALVNTFGLASQQPGVYDIYGVVDFYGYTRSNAPAVGPTDGDYATRKWRVAPIRYEVWLPTAPRPRFELATGAEVDSGEPIVITCQDAEATIMYRFDEEEYAVYNPEAKPVMPARDVTVSAYAVKEGNHDSAVRSVSLKYSGKAGIEAISADAAGEARYYDLQGRPVANPANGGLYIKVENGKASKVAL